MARPIKQGLDYFPLDVNFMNDRSIRRLRKKDGLTSTLLYILIICEIYEKEYYVPINDNYIFDLSEQIETDEDTVQRMIDDMLDFGLFDREMYENEQVLTSRSIQERYQFIKKKRSDSKANIDKYKIVNVTETEVSASETPKKTTESAQSKGKESKGKESKEFISNKPAAREAEKIEVENIEEVEAEEVIVKDEERMNFHEWCHAHKAELRESEDWIASVVRASGRGTRIVSALPAIFDMFDNHVITIGQENDLRDVREYKRRFVVWWRSLDFKRPEEITNRRECFAANGMSGRPRGKSRIEDIMQACDEGAEIALRILKQKENERFRA